MKKHTFLDRHLGPRESELDQMYKTIGVNNLEELIFQTIPDDIRLKESPDFPEAMSENEYLEHMNELAGQNQLFKSYIGMGYYGTVLPPVIQRNIFENPGWYTAYTPYQAEIAQGRLEALVNYQTMVSELTGMELANASLLDEGTAAAEAMTMFLSSRPKDIKKAGAMKFFASENLFPQTLDILKTRSTPFGIELVIGDHNTVDWADGFFGGIIQYPDANGEVLDYTDFVKNAKEAQIQIAVAADLLSLTMLTPPGEWGADAVVGTTQRFGIPLGFGGPHAAYFATHEAYKRQIPGRIIGVSLDSAGKPALRMALQTREQHIKRERATSNICTAQVLLAVMAGMYGVYHGPDGLKGIATDINEKARILNGAFKTLGIEQLNKTFFDTLKIKLSSEDVAKLKADAEDNQINLRYFEDGHAGISLDESVTEDDLGTLLGLFLNLKGAEELEVEATEELAGDLLRTSGYMEHHVFQDYRSETDVMRYIKKLERRDLSLNHSMIALGSCTMKLNAAAEMLPLSSARWNSIHPFAPAEQAEGYMQLFEQIDKDLAVITGFAGTSLQPNSGAQGEYAGLMVIRAYHHDHGDFDRDIVLIPSSAHGTNPASGVMAGMKVVIVKCDDHGNIDLDDLRAKAEQYKDTLSALMVTYPSTHGVFEAGIEEITKIIHDNGGQVYMDGANMNAQVGLTNPGNIGADVCHLNLHKTFSIPHGGGGPGMGPICVAEHLLPFLPSNPVIPTGGDKAISAISAAPFGSGLVTLISYGYIRMLGWEGMKKSTELAIINANYIKARLHGHYETLYSGDMGRCAHEMILECRGFKQEAGVEVTDIAKRLMDYGFHAPTVSFPVAGTLMVEPTESESLQELDRFCDTMISIRKEIAEIAAGNAEVGNNLLTNAPHTLEEATADKWEYPYSRKEALYPTSWILENKFWPTVKRIDQAYGDRNLICTCDPIEAYMEEAEA